MQGRFPRKAGADRPVGYRSAQQPYAGSVMGDGDPFELDRLSADLVHVPGIVASRAPEPESEPELKRFNDGRETHRTTATVVGPGNGRMRFRNASDHRRNPRSRKAA